MAARTVVHPSLLGNDPADWLQWRVERHREPGRPIEIKYRGDAWARVVENRTREGGIVLIRTDITEVKNRETGCRHALPSRTPSPSWRSSPWSRSISTGCSPRRPT